MESPGQVWWAKVVAVIAPVLGALIGCLWGEWSQVMTALLTLIILDVVSGFYRAACQGVLSSAESWRGMLKKVGIFIIVGVAHIVGEQVNLAEVGRDMAAGAFCITEALSIVENVGAVIPIPDWLRDILVQLREKKFVAPPDDDDDKPGDTPGTSDGAA